MALGSILIAMLMLHLDKLFLSEFLREHFPTFVINSPDTARAVLGTLIGGLISLTVFSFSMVMVLLNQASTNYSPRLIPSLVSNKKNQFVLGTFLGTIAFTVLVLFSVTTSGQDSEPNAFSIFTAVVLGMHCLGMFVFFIHSISSSIQISKILERLREESKSSLTLLQDHASDFENCYDPKGQWYEVSMDTVGYFRSVNSSGLLRAASDYGMDIYIPHARGTFIQLGVTMLLASKPVDDELAELLTSFLEFSSQEIVDEDYTLGIKQITEVGVKAMSPGINDPGTALITLDYLTELLAMRLFLPEYESHSEEGRYVQVKIISFETLLYQLMAEYRTYCKEDPIMVAKLLGMLRHLASRPSLTSLQRTAIIKEVRALEHDYEAAIDNPRDLEQLRAVVTQLTQTEHIPSSQS